MSPLPVHIATATPSFLIVTAFYRIREVDIVIAGGAGNDGSDSQVPLCHAGCPSKALFLMGGIALSDYHRR